MSYCDSCALVCVNGVHEAGCPNSWFDPACVSLCDDGTMDTVIAVGDREVRYSADYACDYRDESGALDLRRFIRENMDELMDEAYSAVNDVLDSISNWSEEYNTTHTDSGDAYAHCVTEGYWPDQWKRIAEYVTENFDVTDAEMARLRDSLESDLEWSFEMKDGSIFGPRESGGCVLDSFSLGEIEEQFELSHIEERTGLPAAMIAHILQSGDCEHCVRMFRSADDHAYLYINTDAVWFAVITDETIEEKLSEE